MPAQKVQLEIDQGATFDKTFTWKTGTKAAAVPVDLTGCKARAQIRKELESDAVLLELRTRPTVRRDSSLAQGVATAKGGTWTCCSSTPRNNKKTG